MTKDSSQHRSELNDEQFDQRLEHYGSILRTQTEKAKSARGQQASSGAESVERKPVSIFSSPRWPNRFARAAVRITMIAGVLGALLAVRHKQPVTQIGTTATPKIAATQPLSWRFPVDGMAWFEDLWGEPRMVGTKYLHTNQGVQIFARVGTPLLAVTDGLIAKKGTSVLGGRKFWLLSKNGSQYYYANIDFAPGVENGRAVQAGDVVGFVGANGRDLAAGNRDPVGSRPSEAKSGTAAKDSPVGIVHFEYHPENGTAVKNPYALLQAAYWKRKPTNLTFQTTAVEFPEQAPKG